SSSPSIRHGHGAAEPRRVTRRSPAPAAAGTAPTTGPRQWRLRSSSSFSVDQPDHFLACIVQRVRVNVDAVGLQRQVVQAKGLTQPLGKVIGLQMQAEARRNEVVVEGRVAQAQQTIPELFERAGLTAERYDYLDALAKVERLEATEGGL